MKNFTLTLPVFVALLLCWQAHAASELVVNAINGKGKIIVDCQAKLLPEKSDKGRDLVSYIDGAQANSLADAVYLAAAFPRCMPESNCAPGKTHLTRSMDGYRSRRILNVSCGLAPIPAAHQIYKRTRYLNTTIICSSHGLPTGTASSDPECPGEPVGATFQEGKYQKYQMQNTDGSNRSEQYIYDVGLGQVLKIDVASNDFYINNITRIPREGTAAGDTDPFNYYYYPTSDTYSLNELKYSLRDIEVKTTAGGSDLSLDCSTNEQCQEGVWFTKGTAGNNRHSSTLRGNKRIEFHVIVRNKSDTNYTEDFGVKLKTSVNLYKYLDSTYLFSVSNRLLDGKTSVNLAGSVIKKPLTLTDYSSEVACELVFSGAGIQENVIDLEGGIEVYQVNSLGDFKIRPTLFPQNKIPDYLRGIRRNQVTYSENAVKMPGPNPLNIEGYVPLESVDTIMTAGANIQSGSTTFNCQKVKFKVPLQENMVAIKPYSQCGIFTGVRDYYLKNTINLTYPGLPEDSRNILPAGRSPFLGLYNIAQWGMEEDGTGVSADKDSQIEWANSTPVMPPQPQRMYKKSYLVVRKFSDKGVSSPFMFGDIGKDGNFNQVAFKTMADADLSIYKDDDLVVLEGIAKRAISAGLDFKMKSARFAVIAGFDYNLAFAGGSCLAKMPFHLPLRTDETPLPAAIENASLCKYSIPVKFGDLRAGKVNLNIVGIVPKQRNHTYPVELMMAGAQTQSCSLNSAGAQTDCWEIKSYLPPTMSDKPLKNHSDCHERVCETVSVTTTYSCGPYGNQTCSSNGPQIICRDTYKASCNVLEVDSANECDANTAFRFDGYFNQMVAALGCAAKYENNTEIRNPADTATPVSLSGVAIAGTLKNEGIIPYDENGSSAISLGGSLPANYINYPNHKSQSGAAGKLGYDCIPCQFDLPWLTGDYKPGKVPLDQTSSDAPRLAGYVFTKKSQPNSCVKDTTFQVRYFGSSRCDGTSNPEGHFCSSSNLTAKTCPATGGNVAGSFSIPLCAGSHFGTNKVSASWSPIIVDVTGNGFEITRSSDNAVEFDMKGKGSKMLVDWPLDTYDAAFLVEPNKKGQVVSVDQLFGDFGFKNGFDKLAKKYDKDAKGKSNGKIDASDVNFEKLKLWFDYNRNGISDKGEIQELADYGVTEIDLNFARSTGRGLSSKSLTSTYWNTKHKRYMNIVDVYFGGHYYRKTGKLETKPAKMSKK